MGEVASEADLLNPANRGRVEQALSLIFKGKAGIAGQDPALRGIVNALILKGATSAQQIFNRIQVQKQEEAKIKTAQRVQQKQIERQTQMSIRPEEFNKLVNKRQVNFQTALKTIKLPSGYHFEKDKEGNIININDRNRGINIELSQLPLITKAWTLSPVLRNIYSPQKLSEIQRRPIVTKLKLWEKFSPNKWVQFTTNEQYKFYKNNYNGKLSLQQFQKLKFNITDPNFKNTIEGQKISKALSRGLTDQIQNPEKYGTNARITALLSIGGAVGLSTAGLIGLGSTYYGTLGIAKDVSKEPLPLNFKQIALIVGKNFGLGAVQGLIYGTIFKGGGLVLKKLGKPLLKVSFSPAIARTISKGTQLAIQRGLSILGINYVSRLAGSTTFNIKNIAIGDKAVGVAGLSKDIGVLVGFSIPTLAGKVLAKKNMPIKKKIIELQKFRKGSLNSAYLKAKNAQLKSNVLGRYEDVGRATKLSNKELNIISRFASSRGVSKAKLLEGSLYKQQVKVKSEVPRYEALIKILKAKLRGKDIKIKNVQDFYTFTRYGIVTSSQNSKGVTRAFAIEFNRVGGKITNIGIKTAVGQDKQFITFLSRKVKFVKGKPLRFKQEGVYISKNILKSTKKIDDSMVRILNKLETKKVFLNKKALNRNELLTLKSLIKKSVELQKNPNLKAFLTKLYKDKGITGTRGYTNSLRIQRVKDTIILQPLAKGQKVPKFKIFPKGIYIEVGHTKFKIPFKQEIKIKFKPKISKPIKKFKPTKRIPIRTTKKNIQDTFRVEKIESPRQTMQIQIKKPTQQNILRIERAVKSIQKIVKPVSRVRILPRVKTISLVKQISFLLPLVKTKNAQALRAIQRNLQKSLTIQSTQQINIQSTKQIQELQSKSIQALKLITLVTTTTPKPPTKRIPISLPKPPIKPTDKKKSPIVPVKLKYPKKKPVKKIIKQQGYISKTKTRLNKIPITKKRALDILAYSLDKNPSIKGRTIKSIKKVKPEILRRHLKLVPKEYFLRNRKKFTLRKLRKGRETYEMIEKKKFRKDSRRERKKRR